MSELFTRAEAASFLGVGLTKFDRLVVEEKIPVTTIGRRKMYRRSVLVGLIETNTKYNNKDEENE